MIELLDRIRREDFIKPTQEALGKEAKFINKEERKFLPMFRKGLYAAREFLENEMIEPDMIYSMRTIMNGALPSENYPKLLGKFTDKKYKKYEPLTWIPSE